METSGTTKEEKIVKPVRIQWGCDINPMVQVVAHYLNERKKHG
jgi:hypothetical protein